ncbi:hypothetical protein DFQ26_002497 [Actinomortierella ambigua]|nr:hypothetical protein DFQ26_002497 [Actinomortierella ambigua]
MPWIAEFADRFADQFPIPNMPAPGIPEIPIPEIPDIPIPVIPWTCILYVIGYALTGAISGAFLLPLLVPLALFLAGFTVGGVVAGSLAAVLMWCHMGHIPVGGFVALMQSLGTMGLMAGYNVVVMSISAIVGMIGMVYIAVRVQEVCSADCCHTSMK